MVTDLVSGSNPDNCICFPFTFALIMHIIGATIFQFVSPCAREGRRRMLKKIIYMDHYLTTSLNFWSIYRQIFNSHFSYLLNWPKWLRKNLIISLGSRNKLFILQYIYSELIFFLIPAIEKHTGCSILKKILKAQIMMERYI